ncbi:MAG: cupin domain-containing protein [Gammaproteobacteria bacterium]|nr:cupin domain-containing protein [Gammaproteobacteria bacterium]
MDKPIVINDLLQGGWRECEFKPFRKGIEICILYEGDSTLALLRYQPGATAPLHLHIGLETVIILEGSQRDDQGLYLQGSCVMNPPGYQHSVTSDNGCVVLIQWSKPVQFLN